MWLVMLIVSFSFCSYLIIKSIFGYLEYEVTTKIRLVHERPITFPMVSFCNLNPFTTPQANEYILNYFNNEYKANFTSLDDLLSAINETDQDYEFLLAQVVDSSFPESTKKSFGYTIDDIVLECKFNRSKCNSTEFEWFYSSSYGNCYKFNSGFGSNGQAIPLRYFYTSGPDSGLSLELFVGSSSSSLFSYYENSGLKIFITNQSVIPTNDEGLQAPTGFSTNIIIKKEILINEPMPYSSCERLEEFKNSELIFYIKSLNKTYRQKDCLELCFQKATIEKCGCYDVAYPSLGCKKPCYLNETSTQCLDDNFSEYYDQIIKKCLVICPLECEMINYKTEISYSDYPSRGHSRELLKYYMPGSFQNRKDLNYQEIRENVVHLKIYFDDMKYTLISEKPKILLEDLLANIGGTLSLFLGVSILSIGEFVEIIIQVLRVLVLKNADESF